MIFVCLKHVQDLQSKPDPTANAPWILNPYDAVALELALLQREKKGGAITVLTVGPPEFEAALRTGLAMGADAGIRLNAPQGLDSLSVAKVIAKFMKAQGDGAPAIFCGRRAIDSDAGIVPTALEILLGPCVQTATLGMAQPRIPGLPQTLKAKRATIEQYASPLPETAWYPGALSQVIPTRKLHMISGSVENQAKEILRLIGEGGKRTAELPELPALADKNVSAFPATEAGQRRAIQGALNTHARLVTRLRHIKKTADHYQIERPMHAALYSTQIQIPNDNAPLIVTSDLVTDEERGTRNQERLALSEAPTVFIAGAGIGSKQNVDALKCLADKLGAVLGVTRPVVDAGWAEAGNLVGQSGQSIAPKVYVAFGVSGAAQHLSAVSECALRIAVNNDPGADIFKASDYGVLGDCEGVLRHLQRHVS